MIGLLVGRFGEEKGGIDISEGETFLHMNVGGLFGFLGPFLQIPSSFTYFWLSSCHPPATLVTAASAFVVDTPRET